MGTGPATGKSLYRLLDRGVFDVDFLERHKYDDFIWQLCHVWDDGQYKFLSNKVAEEGEHWQWTRLTLKRGYCGY